MKKKIRRYFRRISKRVKRTVYMYLKTASETDFGFMKPVIAMCLATILVFIGFRLPVYELNVSDYYIQHLAASISNQAKNKLFEEDGSNDIVITAIVLPKDSSTRSKSELTEYLSTQHLYSFYLTGSEIRYLAEVAVLMLSENNNNVVVLDGLNYTYHENRLSFNRITALSFSGADRAMFSASAPENDQIYHVIGTDSIFAVFKYIESASMHLIKITPKDCDRSPLLDYRIPFKGNPSLADCFELDFSTPVSTVKWQTGYNLSTLFEIPSEMFWFEIIIFFSLVGLIYFIYNMASRLILKIKIYSVRSKKGRSRFL